MKLPAHWRRNHTSELYYWRDNCMLDDEDADRVTEEIDMRERQADANRGVINGMAPDR